MLIEVKSTQNQDVEPKGAKRFEFKAAEKLSRLPAYFALMVVAIAVYIRSITTAVARPFEGQQDQGGDGQDALAAPRDQQTAQLDDLVQSGIDDTETGSVGTDEARRGLGVEQGNPWPSPFQIPDFPQLHFTEPTFFTPNVRPFVPVSILNFPVNDNFGGSGSSQLTIVTEPDGFDPEQPEYDIGEEEDDDDGGNSPSGNRAPVVMGPIRLNDVFAGQVVLIALVHLLRGTTDPDGDELSVEDLVVQGADLVATANGWLLETLPGMVGPVMVTYRITDGEAWVTQTATLEILRKVFALGEADDVIVGSPFDDDIEAGAGNDIIDALAGNDQVDGGEGDDNINGGAGDDVLVGGLGNDAIFGGDGNDQIFGGEGDDRLFGEAGDDTIFGEDGNDHIEGGAGKDHLDGGDGDDAIYGNDGVDRLVGGAGKDLLDGGTDNDLLEGGDDDDVLKGGEGDDTLSDGAGDDAVHGEAGDDTLLAGAGDDLMDGGDGYDTLDYSAAEQDMVIDVVGGTSYSDELGTDSFANVEEIVGGEGNDMFVLGGKAMVLSGGKGKDTFVFEVTDDRPSLSEDVVYKILDFVVGDRVRVRDYDLDRDARDAERDMFEAIYGDRDDDVWLRSDIPLQVSHELIDDENWTIIVADLNGDNIYDLAINLQGVMLMPPDNLA